MILHSTLFKAVLYQLQVWFLVIAMDTVVHVYVEGKDGVVSSPQFRIIIEGVNTSETNKLSSVFKMIHLLLMIASSASAQYFRWITFYSVIFKNHFTQFWLAIACTQVPDIQLWTWIPSFLLPFLLLSLHHFLFCHPVSLTSACSSPLL